MQSDEDPGCTPFYGIGNSLTKSVFVVQTRPLLDDTLKLDATPDNTSPCKFFFFFHLFKKK